MTVEPPLQPLPEGALGQGSGSIFSYPSISNLETAEYVAQPLGQSAGTPKQNSQFLSEIQSASLETHFIGAAAVNLSEDRTQGIHLRGRTGLLDLVRKAHTTGL